jgi:hypothetical protein
MNFLANENQQPASVELAEVAEEDGQVALSLQKV